MPVTVSNRAMSGAGLRTISSRPSACSAPAAVRHDPRPCASTKSSSDTSNTTSGVHTCDDGLDRAIHELAVRQVLLPAHPYHHSPSACDDVDGQKTLRARPFAQTHERRRLRPSHERRASGGRACAHASGRGGGGGGEEGTRVMVHERPCAAAANARRTDRGFRAERHGW